MDCGVAGEGNPSTDDGRLHPDNKPNVAKCLWLALYERVEALAWVGRASTRGHRHGIPTSASWLHQSSPAESNSVGTLALTKKFRSGILALISMLRAGAPTDWLQFLSCGLI